MSRRSSVVHFVESDKTISESGTQGGKIIGEHIVLGSLIGGIPLFTIGLIGLVMIYGLGYQTNTAIIIVVLLLTVIGLLLIVGAYNIYRVKHQKNK